MSSPASAPAPAPPPAATPANRRDRAVVPVLGTVLLVALTVALAALVGGVALGVGAEAPTDPAPTVAVGLSADGPRLTLVHRGGAALDVRRLRVRVAVEGEALAHQPPVPFFAARGFRAGPTGPFNPAADPAWTVGERVSLQVAGTNHPTPAPGDRVRVRLYVDGAPVADLTATA